MSAAPRVLLVSHSARLLGAERSLLTLAAALRDRERYAPVILLPRDGPLRQAAEALGLPVIVHRYHHWIGAGRRCVRGPVSWLFNLASSRRLPAALRSERPQLVYTNTLATPFGALLARRLRVPHVWHAREFVEEDMGAAFDLGRTLALRLVGRWSARVLCNSRAVRAKLARALPNADLRVVYNGFEQPPDPAPARARGTGQDTLVIAGSIHPGKGQEDALRALARLRSGGRALRLQVVGTGAPGEVARLRALARDLGIEGAVEWTGFSDDVPGLLAGARVCLVCSRSEAFGRVAVEAMSLGVPVVAARAGGLPEVVTDGETGLLYPPGDASALENAVVRVLEDEALARALASHGRSEARRRFGVEQYVSAVESVFDELLPSAVARRFVAPSECLPVP